MESVNSNASHHYALQVALQTMKERCIELQRRLTNVEEENKELREHLEVASPNPMQQNASNTDNMQLRMQVAELQRQMTQLNEHSNMVSNENRKLWSRLSVISKEQSNQSCIVDKTINEDLIVDTARNSANQNLIRSKTFTQHSPNPNLRLKMISNKADGVGSECDDIDAELSTISLDDVTLIDCEHKKNGAGDAYSEATQAELGFGYWNDEDATATSVGASTYEAHFNIEFKKVLEGLQDMRREAQHEQDNLNAALTMLESNKEHSQMSQKPEMADKSLETDDSLNEANFLKNSTYSPASNTSIINSHNSTKITHTPRLNIIEEKIVADAMDKTCPMCGKIFAQNVLFSAFQEHVEMHFLDDASDLETSIERNFEYISHTVGDF